MTTTIQRAADQLFHAATKGITCEPVRNIIGETDLATAYEVQKINTSRRLNQGARLVGRKIGLTSPAVQKQLGVDQPDYGMLFDTMEVLEGGEIPWQELMQPKVEAEIAFVVGKSLDREYLSTSDVISSIAYALPSIEIVGSRIEGWNIRITDTIADNASASHFVLGHYPKKLTDVDVINLSMRVEQEGNGVVSEGKGADCLGSPINSMIWLARTMARLEDPLQEGDIVLTGALGPMAPVVPGDRFTAFFEGIGHVSVGFGREE